MLGTLQLFYELLEHHSGLQHSLILPQLKKIHLMIYVGFMFLVHAQFMHVKHTHDLLQLCLGGLQCNSTLKGTFFHGRTRIGRKTQDMAYILQ